MNLDARTLLLVAGGVTSLALGLVFTRMAMSIAPRIGFVDRPGGHKSHRAPMPYGGGTAIFLAAFIPILLAIAGALLLPQEWIAETLGEGVRVYVGGLRERAGETLTIALGAIVVHALGLVDDKRALPAYPKLIVLLTVAALLATVGNVRMAAFLGDFGSIVVTTLWIGVIVNAFNFLDNMDGLSAGVAAICMAFFVVCGLLAGQVLVPALGCVFLGAMLGFLWFNFPPARIFMGDAGSLLCGYMLAVVSILTTYHESAAGTPPYALAMPLVILAVPLYDFASVIAIRLSEGRNPMKGDQRHFSHRLVEHGLSRRFAVMTIYLATGTTGLVATLLPEADLRRTITIGVVVVLVLAIVAILESPPRRET